MNTLCLKPRRVTNSGGNDTREPQLRSNPTMVAPPLTPRERRLLSYLKLATAYLGKAVADNLMEGCALSPATALARIEEFINEIEGN